MMPRSFVVLALGLVVAGAGLIWLRLVEAQTCMHRQEHRLRYPLYRWT